MVLKKVRGAALHTYFYLGVGGLGRSRSDGTSTESDYAKILEKGV
jgi:hypothetical protein